MSEITHENSLGHIQKLYHYVGVIAKNHNKIVDHLKDIHKNVTALQENVKAIKKTIQEEPTESKRPLPRVSTHPPTQPARSHRPYHL